jgi:hypothetical protein
LKCNNQLTPSTPEFLELEIPVSQKIIYQLVDDLSGEAIAEGEGETVRFAIDGVSYEIDVTKANAAKLRKAVAPYAEAGRRVVGTRAPQGRRRSAGPSSDRNLSEVREWARAQGLPVSTRGRIPAEILAEYDKAH